MKIFIDGYEANVAGRLGSSQVAFELLKHIEKIDHKNNYIIFLPDPPTDDLPKEREGFRYTILKPKRLWTAVALPLYLYARGKKYDLIFSPTHYIPRFSPIKRVATIFDLSFLHFPEMFEKGDFWKLKNWTKFSAEKADHIITISDFSKRDIMQQYGVDKSKITVAYPGYDKEIFHPIRNQRDNYVFAKQKGKVLRASSTISHTASEAGPYIIYIGTIQPRKNLIRLMEAFAKVATDVRDLNLVVVGKTKGEGRKGWKYEDILEAPKKLGIEDRVIFTGFVQTEDLPALLSGAKAFILPSLWEGFGIPVLEAMACGTPVIVSNVSSLPEVVGEVGLLVDPYSIDQIEEAIRLITTDKKLQLKYSKLGLEQAKKFSWDKMTKTVLKIFEKVASKEL